MNKTTEALKMAYKAEETGNLQDLVDAVNMLVDVVEALESQKPDRTGMVYYKNNACKAKDANSHDCICWTPAPSQEQDIVSHLSAVAGYFYDGKVRNLGVVDACEKAINRETGKERYKTSVVDSQEQEPVAWMYERDNGAAILEFYGDLEFKGMKVIPLYTHPAQPLSDDEIKLIIDNSLNEYSEYILDSTGIDIARAIEQAHGIE